MEKLNSYDTFLLYNLLESVDYEWDFDKGIEIDHRNKITKAMVNSMNKASDKKQWFKNLLERIKSKKKYVKLGILALLTPFIMNMGGLTDSEAIEISKNVDPQLTNEFVEMVQKSVEPKEEIEEVKKFDPTKLDVSENLIEFLKEEEDLKLTAYTINDKMITIGYGHAEDSLKSKYKIGDKISLKEADRLFRKDLRRTTKGVRRIFKQWQKEGVDIKLTQSQFDALVSMAYNMGVGGLRSSPFIQLVKQNKMKEAGERIKTTRLKKGYGGLVKRRAKESQMFQDMV